MLLSGRPQIAFSLVKRGGRLWVYEDGEPLYTPPDFVRQAMRNRALLTELVDRLNAGASYIKSVVWFETATRP